MISFLKYKLKVLVFRRKFRKLNKHNNCHAVNFFNLNEITIWNYSYWPIYIMRWDSKWEWLHIWNYCSIADWVTFLLWGNHQYNNLFNYPIWILNNIDNAKELEEYTNGPIIVEDDVWIWAKSIILSGVTLGKWSIVGAGSVVTKSIPPYSIVGWKSGKSH